MSPSYTSSYSRTSIRKMGLCYWKGALLHTVLLSIFAIQKSAAALVFTNPSLAGLTAGAPVNLTWSGASGTTTVTLQNGTANDLETVTVIACKLYLSMIYLYKLADMRLSRYLGIIFRMEPIPLYTNRLLCRSSQRHIRTDGYLSPVHNPAGWDQGILLERTSIYDGFIRGCQSRLAN